MSVCMYVCMYVFMHVCMHVRTYVCMHVCAHVHTYGCMYAAVEHPKRHPHSFQTPPANKHVTDISPPFSPIKIPWVPMPLFSRPDRMPIKTNHFKGFQKVIDILIANAGGHFSLLCFGCRRVQLLHLGIF